MKTYTAKEIAAMIASEGEGDLTERTIKYYSQMNWIPELEWVGKRRVYTDKHLNYLRAMKTLSKTGRKLADIASELSLMNTDEIEKIGRQVSYMTSNTLYNIATSEVFQPMEGLSVTFSDDFDPELKNEIKIKMTEIISKKNKGE